MILYSRFCPVDKFNPSHYRIWYESLTLFSNSQIFKHFHTQLLLYSCKDDVVDRYSWQETKINTRYGLLRILSEKEVYHLTQSTIQNIKYYKSAIPDDLVKYIISLLTKNNNNATVLAGDYARGYKKEDVWKKV